MILVILIIIAILIALFIVIYFSKTILQFILDLLRLIIQKPVNANQESQRKGIKNTHIILIVLIAIAIGAIVSSYGDASTYENFNVAAMNPTKEYHIVGNLNKNKEQIYDPKVDANCFTFFMIDNSGTEKKVILRSTKPQDFERSEKIVIIGKMEGDHFEASKILLKCPSKYTENKVS